MKQKKPATMLLNHWSNQIGKPLHPLYMKLNENSLFEQMANITKAHGYDILAKQVGELKEENRSLAEALKYMIDAALMICDKNEYPFHTAIDQAEKALKNRKPYNL